MAASIVAKGIKKSGKENAAPPRTSKLAKGGNDGTGEEGESFDDDIHIKPSKSVSGAGSSSLERKLATMTAERDRLRGQRDTFAKQFDELSNLRNTDTEGLMNKYKEKAALQAKAQNDIIASLTALSEKQQARIQSLDKTLKEATSIPEGKADPKEVRALKDEVAKLKEAVREKDKKYTALEKELQAEVAHSRSLQASAKAAPSAPASTTAAASSEELEKDAVTLALYEDITDLNIPNVKIKQGKNGREVTFNCVQTVEGHSLNVKLRSFNELDQMLVARKADNPWVKSMLVMVEGLEHETDKELVNRLGVFREHFTVKREEIGVVWEQLRARMRGEGDFADE